MKACTAWRRVDPPPPPFWRKLFVVYRTRGGGRRGRPHARARRYESPTSTSTPTVHPTRRPRCGDGVAPRVSRRGAKLRAPSGSGPRDGASARCVLSHPTPTRALARGESRAPRRTSRHRIPGRYREDTRRQDGLGDSHPRRTRRRGRSRERPRAPSSWTRVRVSDDEGARTDRRTGTGLRSSGHGKNGFVRQPPRFVHIPQRPCFAWRLRTASPRRGRATVSSPRTTSDGARRTMSAVDAFRRRAGGVRRGWRRLDRGGTRRRLDGDESRRRRRRRRARTRRSSITDHV